MVAALLVRALFSDFPNAEVQGYGAPELTDRIGGKVGLGMLAEFIGTFFLVFSIVGVAVNPRAAKEWAALTIGAALGVAVMCLAPLTGAGFNPARAFGPSLVGDFAGGGGHLPAGLRARADPRRAGRRLPLLHPVRRASGEGGGGNGARRIASAADAAGHLLAQLHALAVANVPLLLQVLRLRHPPGAPVRAG